MFTNAAKASTNFWFHHRHRVSSGAFSRYGSEFDILGGPAVELPRGPAAGVLGDISKEAVSRLAKDAGTAMEADNSWRLGESHRRETMDLNKKHTRGYATHQQVQDAKNRRLTAQAAARQADSRVRVFNGNIRRFAPIAIYAGRIFKIYSLVSSTFKFLMEFTELETRRRNERYAYEICRDHGIQLQGPDLVELLSSYVDLKMFMYMFAPYFTMPSIPFVPGREVEDRMLGVDFYLSNRHFWDGFTPYQADKKIEGNRAYLDEYVTKARENAYMVPNIYGYFDSNYIENMIEEFEAYLNEYAFRLNSVKEAVDYIFEEHKGVKAVFSDIRNVSERLPYSDLFWQAKELHYRRRWPRG